MQPKPIGPCTFCQTESEQWSEKSVSSEKASSFQRSTYCRLMMCLCSVESFLWESWIINQRAAEADSVNLELGDTVLSSLLSGGNISSTTYNKYQYCTISDINNGLQVQEAVWPEILSCHF